MELFLGAMLPDHLIGKKEEIAGDVLEREEEQGRG